MSSDKTGRRPRRPPFRGPTLVWIVICAALVVRQTYKLAAEAWFVQRAVVLALAACALIYLLFSLRRPSLLAANNYGTYVLVLLLASTEVFLRLKPGVLPAELVWCLPDEDRRSLAQERGYFTEDALHGEGLLYSYTPRIRLEAYPWVRIDERGYRNPTGLANEFDVVLLGDSIIFAAASEHDLGDLLRGRGRSVLNLAMGGYCPQLYRDSYLEHVVEAGVPHRRVLVFLFIGNDFSESARYAHCAAEGLDYRRYLARMEPVLRVPWAPWIANIAPALPSYVRSSFGSGSVAEREVRLPYRTLRTGHLWPPTAVALDSPEWQEARTALDEIIDASHRFGATTTLFLIPSPATVYAAYDSFYAAFVPPHEVSSRTLRAYADERSSEFVDLLPPTQNAIAERFIYSADSDCHYNLAGVEFLAERVEEILARPAR